MDFHRSPNSMARVLVQYVASPTKVRAEVMAHFGSAPSLTDISRMRSIHERSIPRRHIRDYDWSVVWMDERHEKNMDEANTRFVRALKTAMAA